jgi:hypothetical protein
MDLQTKSNYFAYYIYSWWNKSEVKVISQEEEFKKPKQFKKELA